MSALKRSLRLREVIVDVTNDAITFSDDDDRFHPDKLRVVSRILERYPAITANNLDLTRMEHSVPIKHVLNTYPQPITEEPPRGQRHPHHPR